jgi:tRNA threonylcarbamoyladenosine biosynthesis protein TsaE
LTIFPEQQAYLLADAQQTEALGYCIAQWLNGPSQQGIEHCRLYLQGELGAGKTALARALLQGLGVQGRIKSPTFTLLEPYTVGGKAVSHFDFYRFNEAQEWADAGFAEVFVNSWLVLAEWPEMAAELLPPADLLVMLEPNGDARNLRLASGSPMGLALAEYLTDTLTLA